MEMKVNECQNEKCKSEFITLDDNATHCIKCGKNEVKVKQKIKRYSLYDNRLGVLLD